MPRFVTTVSGQAPQVAVAEVLAVRAGETGVSFKFADVRKTVSAASANPFTV